MHIDWTHFTPWTALTGGALIGLASAGLALANGRVAGISGILGGLLRPQQGDVAWRLAFLGGLALAPTVMGLASHVVQPVPVGAAAPLVATPWLVAAGLLVGVGTRVGSGCTSGHGVCGLARLSPRSLVATLCFMATGFLTVALLRHVLT